MLFLINFALTIVSLTVLQLSGSAAQPVLSSDDISTPSDSNELSQEQKGKQGAKFDMRASIVRAEFNPLLPEPELFTPERLQTLIAVRESQADVASVRDTGLDSELLDIMPSIIQMQDLVGYAFKDLPITQRSNVKAFQSASLKVVRKHGVGDDILDKFLLIDVVSAEKTDVQVAFYYHTETGALVMIVPGTKSRENAILDLFTKPEQDPLTVHEAEYDEEQTLHSGFLDAYQSVEILWRNKLIEIFKSQRTFRRLDANGDMRETQMKIERLVVFGYSLGAAVAHTGLYYLLKQYKRELIGSVHFDFITFASPDVGDAQWTLNYQDELSRAQRESDENGFRFNVVNFRHSNDIVALGYAGISGYGFNLMHEFKTPPGRMVYLRFKSNSKGALAETGHILTDYSQSYKHFLYSRKYRSARSVSAHLRHQRVASSHRSRSANQIRTRTW